LTAIHEARKTWAVAERHEGGSGSHAISEDACWRQITHDRHDTTDKNWKKLLPYFCMEIQ